MFKKQIVYMMMVSMKFFFNLDHYIVDQMILIAFLSVAILRNVLAQFVRQTVMDMHKLKEDLMIIKQHLQQHLGHNTDEHKYGMLHLDRFKQHFPDKKFWGGFNNGK